MCSLLMYVSLTAIAQVQQPEKLFKRATISYVGYSAEVCFTEKKPLQMFDNRVYYWYKGNAVLHTQGDYSGRLLDDVYVEYYLSKAMKAKGEYRTGLKVGVWREWYPSGEIKEIVHWKNGLQKGKLFRYNQLGQLIEETSYKNGKMHGARKILVDNSWITEGYRNGKKIVVKRDSLKVDEGFLKTPIDTLR